MSNIRTYKKPELAILEEQKKVRDYSDKEYNIVCSNLVYKLLMLLGVSDGKEEHHLELIKFIKQAAGKYTFEEINKAFEMYVNHEFETKVFQQLNAVVFGNVMNLYDRYKAERLRNYRLKKAKPMEVEISEEEKKARMELAVKISMEEFENNGKLTGITHHIYDYLDKQNLIKTTVKRKWELYDIAKSEVMGNILNEKSSAKDKPSYNEAVKRILEVRNDKSVEVVNVSKRIALEEYFTTILNNQK